MIMHYISICAFSHVSFRTSLCVLCSHVQSRFCNFQIVISLNLKHHHQDGGGSGFGLYITKGIINLHKGASIRATSGYFSLLMPYWL
jgi:hypothetical protein